MENGWAKAWNADPHVTCHGVMYVSTKFNFSIISRTWVQKEEEEEEEKEKQKKKKEKDGRKKRRKKKKKMTECVDG